VAVDAPDSDTVHLGEYRISDVMPLDMAIQAERIFVPFSDDFVSIYGVPVHSQLIYAEAAAEDSCYGVGRMASSAGDGFHLAVGNGISVLENAVLV